MTFEWTVEWFNDLSGVWMECTGPDYGMCVQHEQGLRYSVYVFLQHDDITPDYRVDDIGSPAEACDVGEAIVEQVYMDRLGL